MPWPAMTFDGLPYARATLDRHAARRDDGGMLAGMTDLQAATMIANQIVGHGVANPELDGDKVVDDVVAWLSIQFQMPRTNAHAVMALVLLNHGALLAGMIKEAQA